MSRAARLGLALAALGLLAASDATGAPASTTRELAAAVARTRAPRPQTPGANAAIAPRL